ncbi:MAG: hypothetical protein VX699_08495 [Myxococcota bacterium]|nr:hypothetical protein [Myxococcota bacterium]
MSKLIKDGTSRAQELTREAERERGASEHQLERILSEIKRDVSKVTLLAGLDLSLLGPEELGEVRKLLATLLKEQLPPELLAQILDGSVELATLTKLAELLSQQGGSDEAPKAAREASGNDTMLSPEQGENEPHGTSRKGRPPTAGEAGGGGQKTRPGRDLGTSPIVLQPGDTGINLEQLPPSAFKSALDALFKRFGSQDPRTLITHLQNPANRADLATELGLSRGQLLGILYRLEMLQIGKGRNGEAALQLHHLPPLEAAGISMMASLEQLRSLPEQELNWFYRALLYFKLKISKRDLTHWMVSASKKRSELLSDEEHGERGISLERAEELAYSWYLETRYWEALERYRRERQEPEHREERSSEEESEENDELNQDNPVEIVHDEQRDDGLVCFWITDYAPQGAKKQATRHAYVCVDPQTGALLPQSIEATIPRS